MTADELAARWRTTTAQVYRLAREGVIPCVRVGRYRRFRFEAVERWEREQETAIEAVANPRAQGD